MRLITLILLTIKKNGEEFSSEEVYGRKVTFKTLMSHADEMQENIKTCQQMMALVGTLRDYIKHSNCIPLPSQFIEIFGKMSINTFSICDAEMQSIGSGLYLGASVFDHSCQPDAEVVFDGVNLSVRAVKEIPHRDLSKICISYIEQLQSTKDRQSALKEQYYFTCQCCRCTSSEYENLMSEVQVSEDEAKKILPSIEKGVDQLKELKADSKVGPSSLYASCLEQLTIQDGVLGDSHILRVKTLEIAFDACIESSQWADADSVGKQLLKEYRLYYGPYHPQLGICLFKIGKIESFLNFSTSLEMLFEAEKILKVTHGESHTLYQDLLKLIHEAQLPIQAHELSIKD